MVDEAITIRCWRQKTSSGQPFTLSITKITNEYRLKCDVTVPKRFYRPHRLRECVHIEWFNEYEYCLNTAKRIGERMKRGNGTIRRRNAYANVAKHPLPKGWIDISEKILRKGDVLCYPMKGILGLCGLYHSSIYIGNGQIIHDISTINSISIVQRIFSGYGRIRIDDISDIFKRDEQSYVIEWLESTKSEEDIVQSALELMKEQRWMDKYIMFNMKKV